MQAHLIILPMHGCCSSTVTGGVSADHMVRNPLAASMIHSTVLIIVMRALLLLLVLLLLLLRFARLSTSLV
jgi:hypothetical protein